MSIEMGSLESHAYADSKEVNARVTVSPPYLQLTTPFMLDLPIGSYALDATYGTQLKRVIADIAESSVTPADFQFVPETVEPPPTTEMPNLTTIISIGVPLILGIMFMVVK